MDESIKQLALQVARESWGRDLFNIEYFDTEKFAANFCSELAKQQELAAVVISEVSDADREKIAEALARSVGTFGKLGTASSLYKQPTDEHIKELERQRDELLAALENMLDIHGVTQQYADKHIEIPQSWVESSDIARAAIANVKGTGP